MKGNKYFRRGIIRLIIAAAIAATIFIAVTFASRHAEWVSSVFSPFSRALMRISSGISGIFPFSLAEILIYSGILAALVYIISTLLRIIFKKVHPMAIFAVFANAAMIISALFFIFYLSWGLNYYSVPLADRLGLTVEKYSLETLKTVAGSFAEKANGLSHEITRDENGTAVFSDFDELCEKARLGWESLSLQYPCFEGFSPALAKPVLLSRGMSYLGLTGMFVPYTGEANINIDVPDPGIPFTIAHELAHSAGVNPENEANFAAFLVCRSVSDPEFNYAAYLNAFVYCYNALYAEDSEAAFALWDTLDSTVTYDLHQRNSYWQQFEGEIKTAATSVNNTYLKAMNQSDGVKSYGMVVDLLIADYVSQYGNPDIT